MWVKFVDVDELGLKFLISFDCIDRMKNNAQKDAVMMQVHNTLSHSGITIFRLFQISIRWNPMNLQTTLFTAPDQSSFYFMKEHLEI